MSRLNIERSKIKRIHRIPIPKIQIVLSRTDSETDIKVTTMSKEARNRLPPLVLPGDRSSSPSRNNKLLCPIYKRNPSTKSKSKKDTTTTISNSCCSSSSEKTLNTPSTTTTDEVYRNRSRSVGNTPSYVSLPASPISGFTSRYHQDCLSTNPIHGSGISFLSPTYQFHKSSNTSINSLTSPTTTRKCSNTNLSYSTSTRIRRTYSPRTSSISSQGSAGSVTEEKLLDPDKIEEYLKNNPEFLEGFVSKNVNLETLEKWIVERNKMVTNRKLSLSQWKFGRGSEKYAMLKRLALQLNRNPPEGNVLWELALCISSAISATSFVLYLLDPLTNSLLKFSPLQRTEEFEQFPLDDSVITMATYVAKRREPQRMTRPEVISRFKNGLGDSNANLEGSFHILCHPIIRADSEVSGVIELHRQDVNSPFFVEDEEIVNSYLVWGGIALHYAELNSVMNKQKKLNDFLLSVVRSIFQDMVSMDAVIKKVMNFAQRLVDADRASLFLLDSKTKELYARIFDMGGGQDLSTNYGSDVGLDCPPKEIRFPIGTGIAGQVASTGGVLNIPDAYKDERFNRGVDQLTGYVTKSILCMPVFIRSTVIGVVQMVNKKRGTFTQEDEEAFETFAVYCGLALHHAKLYDKIRRSEQKYKVALEVLSYHNTCTDEEFEKTRYIGLPTLSIGLDDFYFKPSSLDHMEKVHQTVNMFVDLFGLTRFDLSPLYRFTLTVKKNYRHVPYHNWSHGFTVANCMYSILKKTSMFRPLECLSLFIGCLCHDLDHRGKNNKFMLESASPLASIYSTSTMEHHHFNQTVTILQQEGHNIFAKLGSEEYKQVLGNIKHCILATDLALFFTNKARLQILIDKDTFSWGVSDHRLVAEAIAMTASDLCASSKPWDIQVDTVKVIFEEFYDQGDLEKRAGRVPIPMMDRDQADEQPASQVGFINGICIPCYDLLYKLIPETLPLLDGCKVNLARWKAMVEHQNSEKLAKALLQN